MATKIRINLQSAITFLGLAENCLLETKNLQFKWFIIRDENSIEMKLDYKEFLLNLPNLKL